MFEAVPKPFMIFLLPAIAAGLPGCGGNETDYFPLEKGWTWEYRITRTTSDGAARQKYYVTNLAPMKLQEEWVVPRKTLAGNVYYYKETAEGFERVAKRTASDADIALDKKRRILLPAPISQGTRWTYPTQTSLLEKTGPPQRTEYRIRAPVKLNYVIESIDDEVRVPAGRFTRCLRVRGAGSSNVNAANYVGRAHVEVEHIDWYAPEVGLVKTIRREKISSPAIDPGELVMELESISRKKF